MAQDNVIAGFARRSITNGDAVLLATCRGRRDGRTQESSDCPPEVNVLVCEVDGRPRVTLGLDLAWIDQRFCGELCALLSERFEEVREDEIFISASHTHSAPQVVAGIGHYGDIDENARQFILQAAVDCTVDAFAKMSGFRVNGPRTFEHFLPIINRKKRGISGKWFQGANAKRYSPTIGRVTAIESDDGDPEFIMVQLACHPVFAKRNRLCADFPGVMRRHLRAKYGDAVTVIFLQGFSGDIRPDFRVAPRGRVLIRQILRFAWPAPIFDTVIEGRMEEFGGALATRVVEALDAGGATEGGEQPVTIMRSIPVPGSGEGRDNCIEVRGFNALPGVRLIGVSGETFADFGREFDEAESEKVRASRWPVGLANGLWGYLPDRSLVEAASGYEYTCWELFGHQGPLGDDYVEKLKASIREVAALQS